jgi:predicted RNA-binding Zn-ribbon protein involved in translation (DUF1610 family)
MRDQPPPTPVRYGARYGSTAPAAPRTCPLCAGTLPSSRARYCSEACKQRAYRLRQADRRLPNLPALTRELQRLRTLKAHTLYECPTCGERYLGVQRCPDCRHFCRSLGLGGTCPHCDELLLITDVLD